MKELNNRQWSLYEYLKERGDKWTFQEQAAMDIPDYNYVDGDEDNFHDCNIRHLMSKDIQAINNSGVIQKIIISGTQGIKLANKDEFTAHLKKQYAALWRKKKRLDKIAKKALTDGQIRIIFGNEREIIHAFIDSNAYGRAIYNARVKKGYTQKQVVDMLKERGAAFIDFVTYTKFENGVLEPNTETREAIAEILEDRGEDI